METQKVAIPYPQRFGHTEIKNVTPEIQQLDVERSVLAEASVLEVSTAAWGVESTVGDIISSKEFVLDDKEAPPFDLSYFIFNGGNEIKLKNNSIVLPAFNSDTEVIAWLSEMAILGSKKGELLELALLSQSYFTDVVSEWYENGADEEDEPNSKLFLLNIDPESSVDQLKKLLAAHKSLNLYAIRNKELDDNVLNTWISIYQTKIISMLAEQIPRMNAIVEQSRYNPELYEDVIEKMDKIIPWGILSLLVKIDGESRADILFRRLDHIRNGYARNENSTSTVVSEAIEGLDLYKQTTEEPIFTKDEVDIFRLTQVTPDRATNIISRLFEHYNLNAQGWTYGPNTTKRTYEVLGKSRKFNITLDDRSLLDTITVGLVHEFSHVFQAINDGALPYEIGKIKGKRSGGMREAGAIANERAAKEQLFGIHAGRANLSYARALEVLENSGNVYAAVKAFGEEKDKNASKRLKNTGKEASDRILRLIRKGFNSQPMVYAEGDILRDRIQEISEAYPGVGLGITCLDLPDQIRLQQIGMLPAPKAEFDLKNHIHVVLNLVAEEFPELQETILKALTKL